MPKPLLPDRLEYLLRDAGRTTGRLAAGAGLLEIGDPSGPPVVTGLNLASSVRRNAYGHDVAEVSAVWDAVPFDTSEDADHQAAPIRDYLVGISTNGNTNYSADRSTTGTAAVFHNLPVGIPVYVRVRARTTAGVAGPYTFANITTGTDSDAPPVPTGPTLEPVLKGVRVKWAGTFAGGAPAPSDLRHLELGVGLTAAAAQSDAGVVGTLDPADRQYTYPTPDYQTYYFALRAVDRSGNKSGWSAAVAGAGAQAVSEDLANTIRVEAAAYGTFGGGNGVTNSGFQWTDTAGTPQPLTHYTQTTNATGVTGQADGYKKSSAYARLNRAAGAAVLDSNTIPVSEAGGCVVSAWVRLSTAGQLVRVEAFAVDGGSNPVAKPANQQPIPALDPNLLNVWQRIALAYSSKRRADVRLRVISDAGTASGTIDVDAVQYEEGDYLTAYAPKPAEITPGSIGATEIGPNSITSEKVVAYAIVAGKIQADAVGANEIRAGAITAAKAQLEDAVVLNAKIRDLAVDNAKIGEAAITSAKVSEMTAERITTGTLRASTRIVAGDAGGNRVEIDYAGVRLYQGSTVTVNLDRASGTGYFRGAIESSTVIGSRIETGTSAPYIRLDNNNNRGRVEWIVNDYLGNIDYVSGKAVAISKGVQILGQQQSGAGGRVILGAGQDERLLCLARRQVRYDSAIRAGTVAIAMAAAGTFVGWPGGSFPAGQVPDAVSVMVQQNGGPVSLEISGVTQSGFTVYPSQGATRVAATRTLYIYAESLHFTDP